MRKTRSALFVAMLATLLVGMMAVGSTAATPRKVAPGASTVAADIGIAPYDMMSPSTFVDEDITFTYTGDLTYPVIIVNLTFPAGITVTSADVTSGTCDTTNAQVSVPDAVHVAISGLICETGETLVVQVDGSSTLAAGTYAVSAEYKVTTPKRVKDPVNMKQVFDTDAILVAS